MPRKSNYKPKSEARSPKSEFISQTSDFRHLSFEEALAKAQTFCAYQERSISEVKEKLFKLKVSQTDISQIISSLQNNNFINEERFANSFVNGKFRNNKWGKIKIRYELIKKHIPENIITSALSIIDDEEYYKTIFDIISKKSKGLNQPLNEKDKSQVFRFALSKGYEPQLISEIIGTED